MPSANMVPAPIISARKSVKSFVFIILKNLNYFIDEKNSPSIRNHLVILPSCQKIKQYNNSHQIF